MNNQEILDFLNGLDLKANKHASNIYGNLKKFDKLNVDQQKALPIIFKEYLKFKKLNNSLRGYSDDIIIERTKSLNEYYDFITNNNYYNIFDSRGKFRPTIIEEFMYLLFEDLINEIKTNIKDVKQDLNIGSSKAYTNLFFSGSNLENFVKSPQIGINVKNQDFAIFRPISIKIGDSKAVNTNLPIVAIENKTYIDKTMLEGAIATAEKVKSGNPYSLFLIVAEIYDVNLEVDPVYSKIDQIYILRKYKKEKNKELPPIYADVLIDLVNEVKNHLTRDWSDVKKKMETTGKII